MSITVQQIPSAISTTNTLISTLEDIRLLLNQAQELASKNWQIDIGSRAPLVVTITPAQQTALIDLYATLKSALVTQFQTLP